ncbi:MAG: DUF2341 domain-containing protein [Elusimicrobia bacterium]|nr:DUF2341 domain-containing protein [Elusimicrobiota bacterium]
MAGSRATEESCFGTTEGLGEIIPGVPLNIANAGASGLSDYQVWIPTTSFTSSEWTDIKSKAQGDMDDFRFTPTTATTTIPYWIDPDTNTPTGFWVRVSTVPTAGISNLMYYGNASAIKASSGSATFELVDNFPGTTLNASKWDTYSLFVNRRADKILDGGCDLLG